MSDPHLRVQEGRPGPGDRDHHVRVAVHGTVTIRVRAVNALAAEEAVRRYVQQKGVPADVLGEAHLHASVLESTQGNAWDLPEMDLPEEYEP